ncbi:hypothetical protein Pla123a_24360 [Posidoniimonas polymericola]|uniref:Stigma-specific protein, Stig1 n=1 Tax=Posidoniimonas polymericola TaxID=2528002 RepID=A0A5C5YQ93_9BACT|nr:hypothetical protein [Posidoniimonas polymericola]TWT77009.1 hypothetical protein Pla123a_24360 [Posidoniimonas polymericola]
MTALQKSLRKLLSLGLVLLIAAASGCACLPGKHCGAGVGCCDAGCEVGCGVGGCGDCCGPNGCDMAFQKYKGCCKPKIPFCVCTGSDGCCDASCGCEVGCGCEADCAVDPGCCAEPGCCADPCCGADACGDVCGCGDCCRPGAACLYNVKYALGKLFGGLVGCSGCDGEIYWNEWHNDPPRCCDPCDKCGGWVGPSPSYDASYGRPCGCN